MAGSLILLAVLTRTFSAEIYGHWVIFQSILAMLAIFALPGTVKALSSDGIYKRESFNVLTRHSTGIGILGVGACLGFWQFNYIGLGEFWLIAAFSFIPRYCWGLFDAYLVSIGKFKLISKIRLAKHGLSLLLVTLPTLFFKDFKIFVISFLAVESLFNASATLWVRWMRKKVAEDSSSLKYAYSVTGAALFPIVAANLDKNILNEKASPAVVASYGISYQLTTGIDYLLQSIFLPRSFQITQTAVEANDRNFLRKAILAQIPIGFGIYLVMNAGFLLTFPFVAKDGYEAALYYFPVISLRLLLVPSNRIISTYLTARKEVRYQMMIAAFDSFVRIVCYNIAITVWGVRGLIGTIVLTDFLSFLFVFTYLFRRYFRE